MWRFSIGVKGIGFALVIPLVFFYSSIWAQILPDNFSFNFRSTYLGSLRTAREAPFFKNEPSVIFLGASDVMLNVSTEAITEKLMRRGLETSIFNIGALAIRPGLLALQSLVIRDRSIQNGRQLDLAMVSIVPMLFSKKSMSEFRQSMPHFLGDSSLSEVQFVSNGDPVSVLRWILLERLGLGKGQRFLQFALRLAMIKYFVGRTPPYSEIFSNRAIRDDWRICTNGGADVSPLVAQSFRAGATVEDMFRGFDVGHKSLFGYPDFELDSRHLDSFERSIDLLQQAAKVVVIWYLPEGIRPGVRGGESQGDREVLAAVRALAKKRNVEFIDLGNVWSWSENTHFDPRHMLPHGRERLAKILSEIISRKLKFENVL